MSKSKLTKEVIERFSITFNKAKNLGITDEDLKYIYEIGPDKFRISIRFNGSRITEVVYGLLNAINRKWEILNSLNNSNQKNDVATTDENEFVNLTLKVDKPHLIAEPVFPHHAVDPRHQFPERLLLVVEGNDHRYVQLFAIHRRVSLCGAPPAGVSGRLRRSTPGNRP